MCDPRQTSDHHAKGHAAGAANPRARFLGQFHYAVDEVNQTILILRQMRHAILLMSWRSESKDVNSKKMFGEFSTVGMLLSQVCFYVRRISCAGQFALIFSEAAD